MKLPQHGSSQAPRISVGRVGDPGFDRRPHAGGVDPAGAELAAQPAEPPPRPLRILRQQTPVAVGFHGDCLDGRWFVLLFRDFLFSCAHFEQEETEITENEPELRSLRLLLCNDLDLFGCGRRPRWSTLVPECRWFLSGVFHPSGVQGIIGIWWIIPRLALQRAVCH
jgi:hypothetical protein